MSTIISILLIILFLFVGANFIFFNKARREGNVSDLIYYWVIIISVVIVLGR